MNLKPLDLLTLPFQIFQIFLTVFSIILSDLVNDMYGRVLSTSGIKYYRCRGCGEVFLYDHKKKVTNDAYHMGQAHMKVYGCTTLKKQVVIHDEF